MTANLRDHMEKLNIFLAVARAGSFHGAAEVLRLSQPSLSHTVQVLEGVIEQQLFYRSRQGVQLTPAGQELLKFSERLAVEVDGIEQRLRLGHQMAGTLNVGTYASFVTYLWPPFLKQFSGRFKDLTIRLKTLRSSEISGALLSRQCHFVVSTLSILNKDVHTVDLYKDAYALYGSPQMLKKSSGKISKSDLKDLPLIYVPEAEGENGETLDQSLWQNGIQFSKTYEMDTFEAVKALAQEGLGLAFLPLRLAETEKGKLKPIENAGVFSRKFGEHKVRGHFLASDAGDPRLIALREQLRDFCR